MSESTPQVTGLRVLDEGVTVVNPATSMDLVGSGVVASNGGNGKATVTIPGGNYQAPTSGAVNGNNQTFVWATAPNVIVIDGTKVLQKTSSDGTVNWTGTTTTVLAVAPTFDIYSPS